MSAPFSLILKVAFGDVDYARILYYPKLFHYCHMALEAFAEEAFGRTYAQLLSEDDRGFPTVRAEAEYISPIPYGTELRLEVSVREVGNSSLKLDIDFYENGTETVLARAHLTKVCVSMSRFKSVLLTDEFRESLLRYSV